MSDWHTLLDFLDPISLFQLSGDQGYKDGQIGTKVLVHEEEFPELEEVDIVIVGCNETRGSWQLLAEQMAPDLIRHHFYSAYVCRRRVWNEL